MIFEVRVSDQMRGNELGNDCFATHEFTIGLLAFLLTSQFQLCVQSELVTEISGYHNAKQSNSRNQIGRECWSFRLWFAHFPSSHIRLNTSQAAIAPS